MIILFHFFIPIYGLHVLYFIIFDVKCIFLYSFEIYSAIKNLYGYSHLPHIISDINQIKGTTIKYFVYQTYHTTSRRALLC